MAGERNLELDPRLIVDLPESRDPFSVSRTVTS